MKCLNCGNENPNNSSFCSGCGSKLEQSVNNNFQVNSTNNVVENQQKNSSKKTLIIILAVVGGLFVLGAMTWGGIYLYKQYRLQQADKQIQDWADQIGDLDSIIVPGDEEDSTNNVGQYNVGDAVTLLDGSKWHIISISGKNVTLLSDTLAKESSGYGRDASYESQRYENSLIKEFIDNEYTPGLKLSLENNGGNSNDLIVRIITADEYLKLSNSEFYTSEDLSECWFTEYKSYDLEDEKYSDVPNYLIMTDSYWTMDNYKDYVIDHSFCKSNYSYYGAYYVQIDINSINNMLGNVSLHNDSEALGTSGQGVNMFGIRPVIETTIDNLK